MAIISVGKSEDNPQELKERELEIKEIISTVEIGFEAVVKINCKISTYRRSFDYYREQWNKETGKNVVFSFTRTNDPNIWKIKRIKPRVESKCSVNSEDL